MSDGARRSALLAAAIVGTARTPSVPGVHEPIDRATERPESARTLLLRAGADAVRRLAGAMVLGDATPIEAAPSDARRPCGDAAAEALRAMLADHPELLADAAARLAESGLGAPHAMIPELLEVKDRATRSALLPLLDARARWLAGEIDAYAWARGVAADEHADAARIEAGWDDAPHAERLRVLRALRASEPDRARALVERGFAGETPERREELVRALSTGLSIADLPFLAQAARDRSAKVQVAAFELAVRLPGTDARARAIARADACVRFSASAIELALPERFEPAWKSDGLIEKSPSRRLGPRAFWLVQIVSQVPPSHLYARAGIDAGELAKRAGTSADAEALREGLARAAVLHRDPELALALYLSIAALAIQEEPRLRELATQLLDVLPPAAREAVAIALFDTRGAQALLGAVLPSLARPWSEDVTRRWLALVERATPNELGPLLGPAAGGLPAAAISAAETLLAHKPRVTYHERAIARLEHALRLRLVIEEEIRRTKGAGG